MVKNIYESSALLLTHHYPKCKGSFDTIINFGENLPKEELEAGFIIFYLEGLVSFFFKFFYF